VDLKSLLKQKSLELLQNPKVMELAQDPRVMKFAMQALQARGRVQSEIDTRVEQLAHSMNLVTKKELRELKRSLRRMERELEQARTNEDEA
jgi:HAMP domain-containing protein